MNSHIDIQTIFGQFNEDWFRDNISADDINEINPDFISFNVTYKNEYSIILEIDKHSPYLYEGRCWLDFIDIPTDIRVEIINKIKTVTLRMTQISGKIVLIVAPSITSVLDTLNLVVEAIKK